MPSQTVKAPVVTCPACGKINKVPVAAAGRPRCGNCKAPLPWITDAGERDFAEVAEQATPLVVVDLWAAWCGPCRMVSPALERVARELAGTIKLVKVDVDRNPRIAQRFEVQAVPTLLILDKGELIARRAGAAPAETLRSWVEQVMTGRDSKKG
ncbi:thioredoxin [Streptomyces malaysiensis subsp. malaysiensis]|uniref:Thioredoxin n=1 Tax=Streptomyces malaysiensis TaxID=92644 RepID=A0ABX6W352_STRMQ|nr:MULTISPECIES: thioredoxin [Streptomyces]ATL82459.1 thioredoxin 2 [Streptomyces malaysiensis]QDL73233.1 thioredoxin [Streptomyces malaysiensis]QPI55934.1 thioredoxin [Streptomyces solisilvae]UHH17405.1 thioredoxin [Streptomyces sp. HNM0561]